ncbi:rhophilin-2-like isoform X2 [Polyodon spathula]|uniref:rhophilin-2-like isoform X2 n=1 Tax=Polyodon spathula TaxID=7913 RepID=UPI001B7EF386|nr:rhophilin-2-like isoform X2 [Polyodon spathula]
MMDTVLSNGHKENNMVDGGYFKKGCNPFAQTGRSKQQNERVSLNQQIIKEMRMRAGAENLLRATTNSKVREMVVLELSYVNSNLQLLMEHLEGLNSSVEIYQNVEETSSLPLIPLGLKETKEADFSVPFKDFILEHYSEDSSSYEDTIADLMDLRKACRTPSRNEAGIDLLSSYFSQLSFVENRFFPPSRQMGIFFTWYDSFTGVPVCQQNIALEKASMLFNIGALYTQIATRCNRQNQSGLENAIDAFQKAAGTLNHLKETFTHTPSYDMSPAMLSMLTRMMLAQAQECVFDKIALPGIKNEYFCLCRMAQEAAKVCDVYSLVYQSMIQTPVKDHVPFFWSAMAQVKTNHYRALAHYFVATALLDHELCPNDDEDKHEKALSQLYDSMPDGTSSLKILKSKDDRRHLGKAHLRKAILDHEEALRIHNLCRHVKKLDILLEILQAGHKRSLNKYSEFDSENDFVDFIEAPHIIAKTEQKAEMAVPSTSKGPLTLFTAKQRWTAPRGVHITPQDRDLGFTLKGDAPVQIQSLDPLSPAAIEGVKEGDYIVSIQDTDCKWLGVSEVMKILKNVGDEGVDIQVISLIENTVSSMPNKSATYCGGLPKTYSMICLATDDDKIDKTQKVTKKLSFLSWGNKNKQNTDSTISPPSATAKTLPSKNRLSIAFRNTDSSLY